MGVFDKFADAPDQIKKEGQEITIRFQKTGPTTARISWNIPAPAAGCAVGASQAYNGIVITVNSKAANYLSTSPKDGTFYNGDPTVDADTHAGDKLDGAMVLAALYDDKTTSYIDVTDVKPRTAYYVSGYAVDAQGRYHRAGVHAYSLNTGEAEWGLPDKAAQHDILIDVVGGITGSTPTGLLVDTVYTLRLLINGKEYDILIDGENATNYTDMVAEIKEQMALLGDVIISPLAPYTNSLYYNAVTKELKKWNGTAYVALASLTHSLDPTDQVINALWYNPVTDVLKVYDSSDWDVIDYIKTPLSPADLVCDQYWFDGTNVWVYKLTHWEKMYTYIQTRNPLLGPLMSCDDYWYNSADATVSVWNLDAKKWSAVDVIYFATDPNALNTGAFWYDETAKKVKQYVSSAWGIVTDTAYLDTVPATNAAKTAAASGHNYIFALDTNKLYKLTGSTWAEQVIVSFPTDPRDRTTSILWWNSTNDTLYAWDANGAGSWEEVTNFTQSAIDPSKPVAVVANSAWYNPDTKEVKIVFKTSCKAIYPILYNGTPGDLDVGTIWYNTETKEWFRWDGTEFDAVEPMYSLANPYSVGVGYYWFDLTADKLKQWSGTAWVIVSYTAKPIVNVIGSFWFDSVNDEIFMWNGTEWIPSTGFASIEMIPPETSNGRTILCFYTRDTGCASSIEVVYDSDFLFSKLTQHVLYCEPLDGESGLVGGTLYKQLGVGDDGSPDERRKLHDDIRSMLGHPVVQVELTKEQLDICADLALMELRKYSSFSYKRGVFFLDLKPNQQTYMMTNKCVGFNKVVGVNSIHRTRGFAVRGGSDNDMYSFAAIQRLYSMGTFDMLTYHLVSAYMEELETLFANRIMFNWNELDRELGLFQVISKRERVLVDCYFERTEQDLMIDRQTGLWLQRWALAEAKMILAQSRGKFATLPGPNGATTLNGSELQAQAEEEKTKLREQLEDGSMQNFTGLGLRAHFIMG